jgi:hypothetical protein
VSKSGYGRDQEVDRIENSPVEWITRVEPAMTSLESITSMILLRSLHLSLILIQLVQGASALQMHLFLWPEFFCKVG